MSEFEILVRELINTDNFIGLSDLCYGAKTKDEFNILNKYLRKLIKVGYNVAYVNCLLGIIESNKGDYEKANKYFDKFEKISSDNGTMRASCLSTVYYCRAYSLFKQGRYDEAKTLCLSVIGDSIGSIRYRLYFLLGEIYLIENNLDNAFNTFLTGYEKTHIRFLFKWMIWTKLRQNDEVEVIKLLGQYICEFGPKNDINIDMAVLYFSKKYNIIFPEFDYQCQESFGLYTVQQSLKYNENKAIYHIDRHVRENYFNARQTDKFSSEEEMQQILKNPNELLDPKYKYMLSCFLDVYNVPYDGIGKYGSNFIKIVTLPNTNKIVTMYPFHENDDILEEELLNDELAEKYTI